MADEGMPFPGTSQITTATEWESFFSSVQLDGVVFGLTPSLNSGARTAIVATGSAMLRGYYKPVSSNTATSIPAASAANRIDRLVMRLDRGAATAADYMKPVVLQGTSGSSTPPALTNAISPTGLWDIPICRWTSTSAGGLTGLVDERYYLWGAFTSAARTSGLLPVWPPRIGLELDTGKVFRTDGAAWSQLLEDTGWITLSMNGPDASAWTNNAVSRVRRINGVVHLRIAIRRWDSSGLSTGDADGSAPIILPAGYAPTLDEVGFGFHSRSPVAVRVETSGTVRVFPLSADVPAGRTVQASMFWFTG